MRDERVRGVTADEEAVVGCQPFSEGWQAGGSGLCSVGLVVDGGDARGGGEVGEGGLSVGEWV